jgi:hypothetical protein
MSFVLLHILALYLGRIRKRGVCACTIAMLPKAARFIARLNANNHHFSMRKKDIS